MEDMCAELLLDESFWKQLCPWMHVQGESGVPSAPVELEEEVVADMRNTLIDQGFLSVGPKQLWTTSHRQWAAGSSGLKGLAKAVLRLVEIGLPPSCLLVYDEVVAPGSTKTTLTCHVYRRGAGMDPAARCLVGARGRHRRQRRARGLLHVLRTRRRRAQGPGRPAQGLAAASGQVLR